MTKFAIIGPGAVGSTIAFELQQHFSDTLLLGRQNSTLSYYPGNHTPMHQLQVQSLATTSTKVDVLFVAVKTYQLDTIIDDIKRITHQDSIIVLAQNGRTNIESLALPNVYQAVVYISGQKEQNTVTHFRDERLHVQDSPETRDLAQLLAPTNLDLKLEQHIADTIWYKLLVNLGINTVTALTRSTAKVLKDDKVNHLCRQLIDEGAQIALAEGVNLPKDIVTQIMTIYEGYPDEMGTSMYYDISAGRPLEVEAIQGYIYRTGQKHNLAIPTITTTYTLLHGYLHTKKS
ncbi:oxidoreductase [Staphylococcus kloosii]|jgi:2-dehydropantoate 2-reductase|uniref:2-dehydropantoate 2-reductase n=1 Tax=Staphylococcus kloosii TaxID=29384 RepID=A0ABQ0XQJ2_9STAP|nr:oxidoreductase [Staphylococcus kloosii]AVQ35160.1 oxidoreductase [Staphylococcus kloosii]MBF7030370.1 oxidoreductase [Staphylococcus kloosii]PNZ03154.1 2-dehydropantoate 2-reductase [Staphylococcus kloosii]PTJ76237.1 oxidoreductase [Staphylococcus kloosii]SUM48202.1 2-dehydropantoate 2-reductase [Staphylococcus kloosii]